MSVAAIGAVDYTKALDGLSLKQAQLMLTTQGIVGEEQKDLLVKQGLIATSDRMSASIVSEALANTALNKEQQEAILIKAGLMKQETKELITGNACTEAKLRAILAEKGIKGAKADTLIASILQTGQNAKEAISWDVLAASIKKSMIALAQNPLTWIAVAVGAVVGFIKVVDHFAITAEKLNDQLQELKATEEELISTQDKLTEIDNKIAEIQSKGTLSITDNADISRLEQEKLLLKDEIELLEKRKELQQDEYNKNAKKYADGQYSNYTHGQGDITHLMNSYKGYKAKSERTDIDDYFIEDAKRGLKETEAELIEYRNTINENLANLAPDDEESRKKLETIREAIEKLIYTEEELAKIKFDRFIIDPNNTGISEGFEKIKSDGEVTAQEITDLASKFPTLKKFMDDNGISAETLATELNNVGTEAENSGGNVDKMTVSLEDLKNASEGIATLSKAFKELSDDGYITIDTLAEIQKATGLTGTEWENYKQKLLGAKVGSKEFNEVMSDLTYEILNAKLKTGQLTDEEKKYVENLLKGNGVVNATEVAASAIEKLVTWENIFNNSEIKVEDKIEKLEEMAKAIGKPIAEMVVLSDLLSRGKFNEDGSFTYTQWSSSKPQDYNGIQNTLTPEEIQKKIQDAYEAIWDEKEPTPKYTNPGSTSSTPDKPKTKTFTPEKYDYDKKYYDNYDESLEDNKKARELYEKARDNLDKQIQDAIEVGDIDLLQKLLKKSKTNENNYLTLLKSQKNNQTYQLNSEILPAIQKLAPELSGKSWDEISNTDLENARRVLEDKAQAERNLVVDEKNRINKLIVDTENAWEQESYEFKKANNNKETEEYKAREAQVNAIIGKYKTDLENISEEGINTAEYNIEKFDALINTQEAYSDDISAIEEKIAKSEDIVDETYMNTVDGINEIYDRSHKALQNEFDDYVENGDIAKTEETGKSIVENQKNLVEFLKPYLSDEGVSPDVKRAIEEKIAESEDIVDETYMGITDGINEIYDRIYKSQQKTFEDYVENGDIAGVAEIGNAIIENQKNLIESLKPYLSDEGVPPSVKRAIEDIISESEGIVDGVENGINDSINNAFNEYKRHIDRTTKALEEQADAYDILINKGQALVDGQQKMYDAQANVRQIQRDITKELRTNKAMAEYLDESTRKLLFNEDDYVTLDKKLRGISSDIAGINTWYNNQINALTEENWYLEESITKEYERRLAMKEKEYEIARAELDLEKKKQELNNILNERNIRMLVRGDDGNYSWQYVHNVEEASRVVGEISDLESEISEHRLQTEQQSILNKKQADIDNLSAEKAAYENRINLINEETEQLALVIENITDPLMDFGVIIQNLTKILYGKSYDANVDYSALMEQAISEGNTELAGHYEKLRNAKIEGEGLDYEKTYNYYVESTEAASQSVGVFSETIEDGQNSASAFVKTTDKATASLETFSDRLSANSVGAVSNPQSTSNGTSKRKSGTFSWAGEGGGRQDTSIPMGSTWGESREIAVNIRDEAQKKYDEHIANGGGTNDYHAQDLKATIDNAQNRIDRIDATFENAAQLVEADSREYIDPFDNGGIASGKGYLFKDVDADELVLDPKQTDIFSQYVGQMENWESTLDNLSKIIYPPMPVSKAETAKSESFNFYGNLEFPNVQNADDFIKELTSRAKSKIYKHK